VLPVWLWGASHDAIWSERKAAICAAEPSWGPVKRLLLARPCASTANFRSCACESLASLGAWRSRLQAHEIAKGACWSTAAAHGPRQHGARTVRVRRSFWLLGYEDDDGCAHGRGQLGLGTGRFTLLHDRAARDQKEISLPGTFLCQFFTAAVWCVPAICGCRWFIHNKPLSQPKEANKKQYYS
jgi:hypothetical protein